MLLTHNLSLISSSFLRCSQVSFFSLHSPMFLSNIHTLDLKLLNIFTSNFSLLMWVSRLVSPNLSSLCIAFGVFIVSSTRQIYISDPQYLLFGTSIFVHSVISIACLIYQNLSNLTTQSNPTRTYIRLDVRILHLEKQTSCNFRLVRKMLSTQPVYTPSSFLI